MHEHPKIQDRPFVCRHLFHRDLLIHKSEGYNYYECRSCGRRAFSYRNASGVPSYDVWILTRGELTSQSPPPLMLVCEGSSKIELVW